MQQAKIIQTRANFIRQSQQAKILQDRADYILQAWATQQATQLATQQTTQLASTQQSTPPAPQQAQEEEAREHKQQPLHTESSTEKQEPRPLQQATIEDIAESNAETVTGSSKPDNESTGPTGHNSNAPAAPVTLILGFSQEQVNGFMTIVSAVVDARLEQRLGNFTTKRNKNSSFPSIQNPPPQPSKQQPSP